jgi:hypothetical protein
MITTGAHSLLLSARENKVGPAGLTLGQKFSRFFCEVLEMQDF